MDDKLSPHHFQQIIARLANYVIAVLEDHTFVYEPFFSDDETSLTERVTILAEWSTGFGAGRANKFDDEFTRDLVETSKMETAKQLRQKPEVLH